VLTIVGGLMLTQGKNDQASTSTEQACLEKTFAKHHVPETSYSCYWCFACPATFCDSFCGPSYQEPGFCFCNSYQSCGSGIDCWANVDPTDTSVYRDGTQKIATAKPILGVGVTLLVIGLIGLAYMIRRLGFKQITPPTHSDYVLQGN